MGCTGIQVVRVWRELERHRAVLLSWVVCHELLNAVNNSELEPLFDGVGPELDDWP
jgi:hypothetical protein